MTSKYLPSAAAAAGRIALAAIFIVSGASKLGAPGPTQDYIASAGLPAPVLAYWIAVLVELGGGLALAAGLRVRAVASVLALFTIAAGVLFHAQFGDRNQAIHFMKNLAIAGGLVQIAALGAGGFTLDALLKRKA